MILVTGGAGHLGNVLVRALLEKGEEVRVLVLPGEDVSSLEGLDCEKVEGNILDLEQLRKAMQGVDLVFHMAALVAITSDKYELMYRVNVEGTRNVIQACREMGARRLVYTSSIHALGRPEGNTTIDETIAFDQTNPSGAYDRTKAIASALVQEAAKKGLDAVIVLPTGVIGPFDYRRSEMGEMFLQWMQKSPSISTDGAFDFVDVRDVAEGHILAATRGRKGETYLLSGTQVTVSDYRRLVQAAAGIRSLEIKIPGWFVKFIAPLAELYYKITRTRPQITKYAIETLLSNSRITCRKAETELGYRHRPLTETVADTVQWWRENKKRIKPSLRNSSV
ncbi:MAG TPA: SDR family oxidoreductase [Anaerolineaceae bacterium]|nr:SDR family oxidoreductase [Anaerolineaceae bacterium]